MHARLTGFAALTLVVAGALGMLGTWQLERAREKEQLLAGIERALSAPAVPLSSAESDVAGPRFRAVRVDGRFDAGRQILLDNQMRAGVPGVRAYLPFLIDAGQRALLVDRGWLPWPDRSLPPPQVQTGLDQRSIEGILVDPPGAGIALGSAPADAWPLVTTRIEHADIERRLAVTLLDFCLEDRHAHTADSIRAGMLPPERHRGYAVQWFGLALAVVIIFLILAGRDLRAGRAG